MSDYRFITAATIAPWTAPLFMILFPVIQSRGWPFHYEVPFIVVASAFMSHIGLYVFGLPLTFLLRRMGWLNLISLTLGGALEGVAVFYLFGRILGHLLNSSSSFALSDGAQGASLGFGVALMYGLISGLTLRSTGRRSVTLAPADDQSAPVT